MKRVAVFLFVLGLPLLAQQPRNFFAWWSSPVVKDMNLSADQTHQIQTIVREYRTKLIDQRAAVEKAEVELEDCYNDDAFDLRRSSDAMERLITARGELTRNLTQMSLRLRALLTADQYRELQKRRPRPGERLRELRQQRMRPNGPAPNGPAQNQPRQ
jgi:Spy/CpxP family protein refolding chaperone